jgi:stress response protein SCP2
VHSGDCKDGRKEGMDETVTIDYKKLAGVTAIVFLISAFAGGTLKDFRLLRDQAGLEGRFSRSSRFALLS